MTDQTEVLRDSAGKFSEKPNSTPEVALLTRGYGGLHAAREAGYVDAYAGFPANPETGDEVEMDAYLMAYDSIAEGQS